MASRLGDVVYLAQMREVDQEGAACHTGDRTCFDARVLELTR